MVDFSTYPKSYIRRVPRFAYYTIRTFILRSFRSRSPQFVVYSCPTEVSFITLPSRLLPYLQYADRYLHR